MKKLLAIILILFCMWSNPVFAENTHSIDLENSGGEDQYLSAIDSASLDVTGDITIEACINPENVPGPGDEIIVGKWCNTDNNRSYFFERNRSGVLRMNITSDGGAAEPTNYRYKSTGDKINDPNNWYCVAVSVDVSEDEFLYYVKGIATDTDGASYGSGASSIYSGNSVMSIGRLGCQDIKYFDGKIDEVRIWSDVRTAQEIADNWNTELNGDEENLVAYYKLNNSLLDETSNDNDLTNNNSCTFSNDVPWADLPVATAGRKKKSIIMEF
ncbi:MAG: LamG domain-containing protein [Candidatus Marinimicrobia bacterium]|nr:LamG domain-containing protein [Candidatus Neomarinimicrobiota bacterium]